MRINDRIRVAQVRVIDDAGEQLGIMETRDAIRVAREQGLDLVEVAPNADPPVCRIIDYGKYQYEAKKKAHDAKKKQVIITVKEVKFRPGTDDHDYDFKAKNAKRWLQDGDKVKATIFFRGREMAHRELGAELLQRLEKDLAEAGEVETRPRMEGNQMFFIFTPKRAKTSTAAKQAALLTQAAAPAPTTTPVQTEPPSSSEPPASPQPTTGDEQS